MDIELDGCIIYKLLLNSGTLRENKFKAKVNKKYDTREERIM